MPPERSLGLTATHAHSLLGRYGLPPAEIERRSLARLEALAADDLPAEPTARQLALRIVYAAGDPSLAAQLRIHPAAIRAGAEALRQGGPLVVDVAMVAAGIREQALRQLGCRMLVAIAEPRAAELAAQLDITRSAAAMRLLAPRLAGGVVAIGNAPTALLELLDQVDAGAPAPAVILGLPVGMVAAPESKAELVERDVPFVSLLGTRGGSPLAAAAVNALLEMALDAHGSGR